MEPQGGVDPAEVIFNRVGPVYWFPKASQSGIVFQEGDREGVTVADVLAACIDRLRALDADTEALAYLYAARKALRRTE
jgi:hypothetical protein